jgi:hypothetical protein
MRVERIVLIVNWTGEGGFGIREGLIEGAQRSCGYLDRMG